MKASSLLSSYLNSSDDEEPPSPASIRNKAKIKSQSFLASILMDSSDEEGMTTPMVGTSVLKKDVIEKGTSTPTKGVRFDPSVLNMSDISSIAGGDSVVAPDPNRSKVAITESTRKAMGLEFF